ncbi:hypothetical protein EVAR_23_1 [Eumeta japonica]|uniref:Uncharacterized protein n=1 Tax=Eumeta variegata TaxID=151549 RepID=A0A4C1S7L6_EUMVA|nr:hypothetical protein EVAR_23_1 [Eumeta japonica]
MELCHIDLIGRNHADLGTVANVVSMTRLHRHDRAIGFIYTRPSFYLKLRGSDFEPFTLTLCGFRLNDIRNRRLSTLSEVGSERLATESHRSIRQRSEDTNPVSISSKPMVSNTTIAVGFME